MKKSAPPAGRDPVAAFLAGLKHPLKAEIEAARGFMRAASPVITEEIKWNSLTFRTTESFATVNLRSVATLQFVFHLGAKKRAEPSGIELADPAGLVKWLAKDRCLVTLGAGRAVTANRAAFQEIIRRWIVHV